MPEYDEFASGSEYQPGSEVSDSEFNDHLLAVCGKQKEKQKERILSREVMKQVVRILGNQPYLSVWILDVCVSMFVCPSACLCSYPSVVRPSIRPFGRSLSVVKCPSNCRTKMFCRPSNFDVADTVKFSRYQKAF